MMEIDDLDISEATRRILVLKCNAELKQNLSPRDIMALDVALRSLKLCEAYEKWTDSCYEVKQYQVE